MSWADIFAEFIKGNPDDIRAMDNVIMKCS